MTADGLEAAALCSTIAIISLYGSGFDLPKLTWSGPRLLIVTGVIHRLMNFLSRHLGRSPADYRLSKFEIILEIIEIEIIKKTKSQHRSRIGKILCSLLDLLACWKYSGCCIGCRFNVSEESWEDQQQALGTLSCKNSALFADSKHPNWFFRGCWIEGLCGDASA